MKKIEFAVWPEQSRCKRLCYSLLARNRSRPPRRNHDEATRVVRTKPQEWRWRSHKSGEGSSATNSTITIKFKTTPCLENFLLSVRRYLNHFGESVSALWSMRHFHHPSHKPNETAFGDCQNGA